MCLLQSYVTNWAMLWPFELHRSYHRRHDIHARFGGQQQGGISTPADAPGVFIFISPGGQPAGYRDFIEVDGTVRYTGQGQFGDMRMIAGNRAIRDHVQNGKDLLLFQQIKKGGPVRFEGLYVCVGWEFEEQLDIEGSPRKAIVFTLVPKGRFEVESEDLAQDALPTLPLAEVRRQASLAIAKLFELPRPGVWYVLTGANGSGKSQYLGQLAEIVIKDVLPASDREYSKVICLSGTVFERFPRIAYEVENNGMVVYLGHRTNHNMFSAISPFRRLVTEILRSRVSLEVRYSAACNLLEGIGFKGEMRIVMRDRGGARDEPAASSPSGVSLRFSSYDHHGNPIFWQIADQLDAGELHVSDVMFFKEEQELFLADLSSGQRGYILAGLAFCFCVASGSLILFDEPENSLHPEWQSEIILQLDRILTHIEIKATVVVATHSPLIAASIPNTSGHILDLATEKKWKKSNMFGKNADSVLSDQFGLRSARSASAIEIIQSCLTLIAESQENSGDFRSASEEFMKLGLRLTKNDPLYETVETIKAIIREKR